MKKLLLALLLLPSLALAQAIPLGAIEGFANTVPASSGGGPATSITSGTTVCTGCTNTAMGYDDGGVIKFDATSPTWVKGTGTLTVTTLVGALAGPIVVGTTTFGGGTGGAVLYDFNNLVTEDAGLKYDVTLGLTSGDPATKNALRFTPGATGVAATLASVGIDTDSSINIKPKGLDDGNTANAVFISPITNPSITDYANLDLPSLVLEGNGGSGSFFQRMSSSDAFAIKHYFMKSRGTIASPTIVNSGDQLGVISFNGFDPSSDFIDAVQILAKVDGTPGADDMPGRLEIKVTPDGSNSAELALTVKNDKSLLLETLKTTGAASGKKTVCVDTSTGKLYASSTGTDCSN